MTVEKEISIDHLVGVTLNRIISDEDIELKVIISSGCDDYFLVQDIDDESRDIAVPRTVEGIDKLIAMLEKAKKHI